MIGLVLAPGRSTIQFERESTKECGSDSQRPFRVLCPILSTRVSDPHVTPVGWDPPTRSAKLSKQTLCSHAQRGAQCLSLSLSLSLSLHLSLPLSVYLSLCHSLSLSLSLSPSLSASLSIFLSVSLSLSLPPSLPPLLGVKLIPSIRFPGIRSHFKTGSLPWDQHTHACAPCSVSDERSTQHPVRFNQHIDGQREASSVGTVLILPSHSNGPHLNSTFLTSARAKSFTVLPDIHPFMHTFTHRLRCDHVRQLG